ncbi:class I SAM-dependent methyltransferase [Candidatus Woesearchaeota archaeon]|nr:class I SAM-dependent methyltransferase [Candidatus Woesearchaeota archaeon]
MLECTKCRLARTYPLPFEDDATSDMHQVAKIYSEFKFSDTVDEDRISEMDKLSISFVKKFKKSGKILDVGCGAGHFMIACKKIGFECEGVEVDKTTANYAISKRKLKVYSTDFLNAEMRDREYDVIAAIHILEHVVNPQPFLEHARKKLKSDGVLIVSVPNFGGLLPKVLKGKWYGLQMDGHVWQFTPETLKAMLEEIGFKVISAEVKSLDHGAINPIISALKNAVFKTIELFGMGDNLFMAAKLKQ